jgi:hypothetical protein
LFFLILKPVIIVTVTSLVYGLLEPDFGWNTHSLVFVLSLGLAIGVITYVYDGGQVVVSERMDMPATLRFFPLAILIAGVSVAISRLVDLTPGFIFGFVAAATILASNQRREGQAIFYSMVAMIAASILAWALIGPFRELARDNGSWWAAVLESASVAIFVGGIEGLLFLLLPLEFMDGRKVWEHSKLAWFAVALPVLFIFFHVIINQEAETFGPNFGNSNLFRLIVVALVALALTVVFWAYFLFHNRRRRALT